MAVAAKLNTISAGMARPARIEYLPAARHAANLWRNLPGSLPW